MVAYRYFFAFAGFLLLANSSVCAVTTSAENYLGMLIEKDEYVRLQDCDEQMEYTLAPSGKYGYDAIAELISLRKNTTANIPISVRLNGSIEENINNNKNRYFLVNDIASVQTGKTCYIAPTKPLEVFQTDDVIKKGLSEKEVDSQLVPKTQTILLEKSRIKNENATVPFEVTLDEAEKTRKQVDIQAENGEITERALDKNKLKGGVEVNQPNVIYEEIESLSPVRNSVIPLSFP